MASENGGSDKPPSRRRGRPAPATIDLKATEVETPAPPQDDKAAQPDETTPAAEAKPDVNPESAERSAEPLRAPEGRPLAHMHLPLAVSALAGAIGAAAVFGVLWFSGVLAPGHDTSSQAVSTAPLEAKITALEAQLRELSSRPVPTSDNRAVGELQNRLATAEREFARLNELATRVQRVEAASSRPLASDPALIERFAAAESTVKSLSGEIAALDRRASAAAAAAAEAQKSIAVQSAAPVVEQSAVEAIARRVAALEQAAKTLQEDFAKAAPAGDRAVRWALVAASLRDAVERGEPFAAELAAAKSLGTDPAALASLESFAASGVPSGAALVRELSELIPAVQRAAAPASQDGGLVERLQASAAQLVRIRPLSEPAGDDPAAIISRIDAKAVRSDIAGALQEFAKLPAAARAPAEAWIKKAQARTNAIETARRLAAAALAALGKPAS